MKDFLGGIFSDENMKAQMIFTFLLNLLGVMLTSAPSRTQYRKVFIKIFSAIWKVFSQDEEFVKGVIAKGVPIGDEENDFDLPHAPNELQPVTAS